MLTNSFVAGVLAASYVVVLFLHLNPALPLHPTAIAPLAMRVGLFYAVTVSAIVYAVLLLRALLGRDRFSPAWVSVSVLAWAGFAVAVAGAVEVWANVNTFGVVLEAKTTGTLWNSAIVVGGAAALLFLLAITQRYTERRALWAASVCIVAALSVAIPVVLRGPTTGLSPELVPQTRALDIPSE